MDGWLHCTDVDDNSSVYAPDCKVLHVRTYFPPFYYTHESGPSIVQVQSFKMISLKFFPLIFKTLKLFSHG
jgi:hypothetical protein